MSDDATDVDARIKSAAVALAVATAGACDCGTKSPDPAYHRADCTYAVLRFVMARVDRIIARRADRAEKAPRFRRYVGVSTSGQAFHRETKLMHYTHIALGPCGDWRWCGSLADAQSALVRLRRLDETDRRVNPGGYRSQLPATECEIVAVRPVSAAEYRAFVKARRRG